MTLADVSIRTRLAAGFTLMLALLIAVAAVSLQRLSQFNADVEQIVQVEITKMVTGAQAGETILRAANHTGNVLLLQDPALVRQELDAVRADRALVNDILESIGATSATPANSSCSMPPRPRARRTCLQRMSSSRRPTAATSSRRALRCWSVRDPRSWATWRRFAS